MSSSTTPSTSRSNAPVLLAEHIPLGKYVFIRPITSEDKERVARFIATNPERIVGDEKFRFLVMDWDRNLIGLYEKSENAFAEARQAISFMLQWVQ